MPLFSNSFRTDKLTFELEISLVVISEICRPHCRSCVETQVMLLLSFKFQSSQKENQGMQSSKNFKDETQQTNLKCHQQLEQIEYGIKVLSYSRLLGGYLLAQIVF